MRIFEKISAKHIPSVDLAKFIMAIFVVAIHTHPYNSIENSYLSFFIQKIISLAVPFFFVASGFFLWRKIDDVPYANKLLILKKWIAKLIKLYVIWTLIYLPFTIYGYVIDGLPPLKALLVFCRNFLFVGENMYSWPLWYLLAMISAGIYIYILIYCRIKKSHIYAFALLALLLGFIIDSSKGTSDFALLYFKLFYTTRNGLFVGFPYLLIGAIIASNGIIVKRSILIPSLIVGFIILCQGIIIVRYLVAYLLFSLIANLKIKNDSEVLGYLRLSSVVIYLTHMIFVGGLCIFSLECSPIGLFVIVTFMSLLTARIVINNQKSDVVKLIF